jgi:hypothetical protein
MANTRKHGSECSVIQNARRLLIVCCDGVRLPSQNCGLRPVVLSPGDNDVDQCVDEIG